MFLACQMSKYLLALLLLLAPSQLLGEVIFESSSLGSTGIDWAQLENQTVPGTNVSPTAYNGVRFQLEQTVNTHSVGGHFVQRTPGTLFGALVALDNADDIPDTGDLTSPDVLGHTLITFPAASDEVFAELSLRLEPGWYALVFGSGLFGADGSGGAVRNGIDIGDPSYIGFQPGFTNTWGVLSSFFDNHRFVLRGEPVPGPFAATLVVFALTYLSVALGRSIR